MARKEVDYIAINKLHGKTTGAIKEAKGIYMSDGSILSASRRTYIGSTLCWDVWKAIIEANNISVPSTAVSVKDYISVSSYGVDFANVNHQMGYSINPTTIEKNTSAQPRQINITITQTDTGEAISVIATQAANVVVSESYGQPSVSSASVNTIAASGGTATLTIKWSQVKTTTYSNGDKEQTTLTGTSTAKVTNGSGITNTSISNGNVNVPSAGYTTYTGNRTAYTITAYDFTANGVSRSVTGASISVLQSQNVRTTISKTYNISATPDTSTPNAAAQKISISIASTYIEYYSYTSGAPNNNSGDISTNCTISTDKGTLSNTTVANGGETTLTIGANTSTSANVVYTLTLSNGTTKTLTITQQKDAVASADVIISRVANTPQAEEALADGTDADVAMTAVVTRKTTYISGNSFNTTKTEVVSISSMVSGSTTITGATVAANNLGTSSYARRVIATITKITGTVAGGTVEWTGTLSVYQQANVRSTTPTTYGTWVVTCTNSATTNIANTGGTMSVVVNSYRTNVYTWTSGSNENVTEYGTGSIVGTNCTVSASSFTGKSGGVTITGTISENPTKNARTCTISVTSNSVTKTASRTQNESVFVLTATPPLVAYGGGNSVLQIVSTRNGKALMPSVSISGISGANIVSTTLATDVSTAGMYYCTIYIPANTSTSSRTLTASISQTGGNSTTATITQSAKPQPTKKAYFDGTFAFRTLGTNVTWTAIVINGRWSAVGDDYGGGTLTGAYAVVRETESESGNVVSEKTLGDIVVEDEGTAAFGASGLTGSQNANYVFLYFDGKLQEKHLIIRPTT